MGIKDNLLGLVVIVAWGLNFVILAIGLEDVPPLLLGAIRFLLVAGVGSFFVKMPKMPVRWWIVYALPMGFLQFAFLFVAMANGMPSGLASLVLQAQAIFTMLIAIVLLKEKIEFYQVVAISLAVVGLGLIAMEAEVADVGGMSLIGFVLTLFAALSWAFGNISARSISNLGYKADLSLVVWSSWIPPLPFLVMSFMYEGKDAVIYSVLNIGWSAIGAIAYVVLIATIVGYSIWGYLISRHPASQVAPLTLGVPVVGLTASTFVFDEVLALYQWVGVALVLCGLLFNAFGAKLLESTKNAKWGRILRS
ncbi:EamA family transporter [Marinomonas balearica]|uniref:DME family drug/metabolite transporter/O-acetylserine/cysteine efflux transporter n=1 Tax=Marinomonas balearica TaxID=491947 RepID=A0A4V3CH23_9GAMM|nr:EamA family transporter [Marinomonas balearica]TDO99942.1 DME family drug/metabolite transporter/O-acetylserine/cysteine efflux transporter [Marinomonas balearica]